MIHSRFAVIGVGNMAKSIMSGMISSNMPISDWIVFDKFSDQYQSLPCNPKEYRYASDISEAVLAADCILLSVKPQNFPEILSEIRKTDGYSKKLYISIAAGLSSESISNELNGAKVIRVLPNLPMTIGMGVSLICKNDAVSYEDMSFVQNVFSSSGSIMMIREEEMNRMIGITSSSPAYVFQFIDAVYQGALAQDIENDNLIDTICDVVIGSAQLLKSQKLAPKELIAKVASKGGTTEQALKALEINGFDDAVKKAMLACTRRADELGNGK